MTLLEVVLGVSILCIVCLSFINLFTGGWSASMESGRISKYALLAQAQKEELRATPYAILAARQAGTHGGSLPGLGNMQSFYRITAETMLFNGYPVHGLRLDLTIMQGERELARLVSFIRER